MSPARLPPLWVRVLLALVVVALFFALSNDAGRDALRHFVRLVTRALLR